MRKTILFTTLLVTSLFATHIKPITHYEASGSVTDIVVKDTKLYTSTIEGVLDVFDLKSKKIINKIYVPKIKDFMGDDVTAKIYSVDVLNGSILLLSQANMGYRNLFIYKNSVLKNIINVKDSLSIAKAKFLDENTLMLGLLSNEIISFDIKSKTQNWLTQASGAKFSDFALNDDKTQIVVADESGDLKILDTKSGKILHILKGQNLDNVFQVDYKNNIIATAGQDRRTVVYKVDEHYSSYYKQVHFLIYSVGLSPSGKLAGFASDEQNNITVFNTSTKEELGIFSGNKMTLTKILFIDENRFLSASDDKDINLYQIK